MICVITANTQETALGSALGIDPDTDHSRWGRLEPGRAPRSDAINGDQTNPIGD